MADVVVMMQAGPPFEDGWEQRRAPSLFDGLLYRRSHDGYFAFRRQMRSLTHGYDGAALLIHDVSQTFMSDRPLRDENSRPGARIMRARTYGSSVLDCWPEVSVTPGRTPLFHIRSRHPDNTPVPTPEIAPASTQ